MAEILQLTSALLLVAVIGLLAVILTRISGSRGRPEIETHLMILKESVDRVEGALRQEFSQGREESLLIAKHAREELSASLVAFGSSLRAQMAEIAALQKGQLDTFSNHLLALTQNNEQKLEQIRSTVDEKLHATLEQRLGQSFQLVSDRLELVHKGLGEMQSLATGVGDLKKVLTNVKARGTWGEFQLGTLLEQVLTPEQYARNIVTKSGTGERVEFAIKLPGREGGEFVWLPIDAKFPQEDYQRLLEAQDQANPGLADEAARALETRIKIEARSIREKYLDPPGTTDFAIMFLPIEGLYAEVLRRPGLADVLQREHRVSIAGPTTLAALLNSLQMGFRTLAIEKRSSEVWELLGAVKTEFGRFGDILEKTQKKLLEASNTIDTAAAKSRTIERRLKNVQELPPHEGSPMISAANDGKSGLGFDAL